MITWTLRIWEHPRLVKRYSWEVVSDSGNNFSNGRNWTHKGAEKAAERALDQLSNEEDLV